MWTMASADQSLETSEPTYITPPSSAGRKLGAVITTALFAAIGLIAAVVIVENGFALDGAKYFLPHPFAAFFLVTLALALFVGNLIFVERILKSEFRVFPRGISPEVSALRRGRSMRVIPFTEVVRFEVLNEGKKCRLYLQNGDVEVYEREPEAISVLTGALLEHGIRKMREFDV